MKKVSELSKVFLRNLVRDQRYLSWRKLINYIEGFQQLSLRNCSPICCQWSFLMFSWNLIKTNFFNDIVQRQCSKRTFLWLFCLNISSAITETIAAHLSQVSCFSLRSFLLFMFIAFFCEEWNSVWVVFIVKKEATRRNKSSRKHGNEISKVLVTGSEKKTFTKCFFN